VGLSREDINCERVERDVLVVAEKCRSSLLDLVVGGGVSPESINFLRRVEEVHLSRFETRKVVFSSVAIQEKNIEDGLLNAVHFEMLWLLNKQAYYESIGREDLARIEMLRKRWNVSGPKV